MSGDQPTVGSVGREHPATLALRAGSVDRLTASLRADLERDANDDPRDVMIHLTPYHDAAARLGSSPRDVFDAAAEGLPDRIAELARTFGRRSDFSLAVMGWRLDDGAEGGPAYRFAWPRWTPRSAPTRREGA